jgi:glucose/arabinose dehydrogenase
VRKHSLAATRLLLLAIAFTFVLGPGERARAAAAGGSLPPGFQESIVFDGLDAPTTVRFARDGRVFVAEKAGIVKVFDSLDDTTPAVFADLRADVHNFWDRGLLGLELDPDFPDKPYVYVLYTRDAVLGGNSPRWGNPEGWYDACPTPPGPTENGCVVSGRLARLTADGNMAAGPPQVLIDDWCQQYPSHSVGDLEFGEDGALYVSAGDGASFTFTDWGAAGSPVNPCGDPPGPMGATLSPPTAEGGALRSQDVGTTGDPTGLDGTILRVDPGTGDPLPDNPLSASSDPNARRIVAYGFRNPLRFAVRPGTGELWVGDVGWDRSEEINRVETLTAATRNFGWPCFEGAARQDAYVSAGLSMCTTLAAGSVVKPFYAYDHEEQVQPGESCPTGSSSVSGLAFYPGGTYPGYAGALFFTDYSRQCIWVMHEGANGLPDPATRKTFLQTDTGPVDLEIGADGNLFYVDHAGGTIRRITYSSDNGAPSAVAQADQTDGSTPLTVHFDGTGSTDPNGDALSYEWDLDGDGVFDDSTDARPTFTYMQGGAVRVVLRVTDSHGASGTDSLVVNAGKSRPLAAIVSPGPGTTWKVGERIDFSGSASDPEDGLLDASRLTWSLVLQHCPLNCHEHTIQRFPGVADGFFIAPDHEYPSRLELRLTATDSEGLTATQSVSLEPKTVSLSFGSTPRGLQLVAGPSVHQTPFTRTVINGSKVSVDAPSIQTHGAARYRFASWSDGGARSHVITATSSRSMVARYVPVSADLRLRMSVSRRSGVRWLLRVTNTGPASARNVVVTDTLPWRARLHSARPSRGSCSYRPVKRTVRCLLGTLASGRSAAIALRTPPRGSPAWIVNRAAVRSSTLDLHLANNSSRQRLNLR